MVFDNLMFSGQLRKVIIKNYIAQAQIGVYEHEKNKVQKVRFNVDLYVRKAPGIPREFSEVYNYDLVPQAIEKTIARGHFDLQETLIGEIARELLKDQEVAALRIRSEKLEVYPNAESAGIEEFFVQDDSQRSKEC